MNEEFTNEVVEVETPEVIEPTLAVVDNPEPEVLPCVEEDDTLSKGQQVLTGVLLGTAGFLAIEGARAVYHKAKDWVEELKAVRAGKKAAKEEAANCDCVSAVPVETVEEKDKK